MKSPVISDIVEKTFASVVETMISALSGTIFVYGSDTACRECAMIFPNLYKGNSIQSL
jgi:threonine aldolase